MPILGRSVCLHAHAINCFIFLQQGRHAGKENIPTFSHCVRGKMRKTTRASNPTEAFDRFSVQNMEASPCYILFSGLLDCLFGRHQVNAKTYLCQCSWVHKSQVWHPFTSRHHQSIKGNNVVWCWIQHAHQHLWSTNICFRGLFGDAEGGWAMADIPAP